jgi:tetratricopeptide (TPR) repeat protein
VRYVLEGSVRKAGPKVRIAVKLTEAASGAQIWADRFEDTLDDVFALQDKVALAVAGVIEPTVREAEIRRAAKRPTENPGSYDLYLRAQSLSASANIGDFPASIDLLDRAIALDPNFGPALATAASLHAVLSLTSGEADRLAHREQCLALGQRALACAGDDPAVVAQIVGARMILGADAASIEPMIDRALALNPGSASSWYESARLRVAMGDPDLAVSHLETAMRLDPLSALRFEVLAEFGAARLLQGRYEEAIVLLEQSLSLRPSYVPSDAWLASALGHAGRHAEAATALARFRAAGIGAVEDFAQRRFRTEAGRTMFLAGIARAETQDAE